jgi:hypothetical protein
MALGRVLAAAGYVELFEMMQQRGHVRDSSRVVGREVQRGGERNASA